MKLLLPSPFEYFDHNSLSHSGTARGVKRSGVDTQSGTLASVLPGTRSARGDPKAIGDAGIVFPHEIKETDRSPTTGQAITVRKWQLRARDEG